MSAAVAFVRLAGAGPPSESIPLAAALKMAEGTALVRVRFTYHSLKPYCLSKERDEIQSWKTLL